MKLKYHILILLFFTLVQYCFADKAAEGYSSLSKNDSVMKIKPSTQLVQTKSSDDLWIEEMSNRLSKWIPDALIRKRVLTTVLHEATINNLDPQLVLSVITVESQFNKYAVSNAGAIGLMQIMPFWLKEKNHLNRDLFDINTNIHLGCSILREYLDREHGNLYYALGRYNGSRGQDKYPSLVLKNYSKYWKTA